MTPIPVNQKIAKSPRGYRYATVAEADEARKESNRVWQRRYRLKLKTRAAAKSRRSA